MDTNGNYIQNQFCSYEIALKLKELGFNEWCLAYQNNTLIIYDNEEFSKNSQFEGNTVAIPIWQQAERWFRDIHNYYIAVYRLNNKWCGDVYDILGQRYITSNALSNVLYDTYEESREQAILKAIELCQK